MSDSWASFPLIGEYSDFRLRLFTGSVQGGARLSSRRSDIGNSFATIDAAAGLLGCTTLAFRFESHQRESTPQPCWLRGGSAVGILLS
jgi:hypothetical protein